MMSHWQGLQMPKGLSIDEASHTETYGKFVVEPLEKGYGVTLGNSMRRVLLTSLMGAAITRIRIQGVKHEFSAIPGVKEDGTEFILNVKGVVLRMTGQPPKTLYLRKTEAGPVTAGDIEADSEVEVVNKDHYLCTLDEGGSLDVEFEVETGRGYTSFLDNRIEDMPIGVIPVDSIYAPVTKVKYDVENTRVSQTTDYERLVLEVETDGTLTPYDAVVAAAKIMLDHVAVFIGDREFADEEEQEVETAEQRALREKMSMKIDELELGVRALNCLYGAGINTVGDLVSKTEDEIMKVPHLGKKSLSEIQEKLTALELNLKEGE